MNFFEKELYALVKIFLDTSLPVFILDPGDICIRNYPTGFYYVTTRNQVSEVAKIKEKFNLVNLSGAKISSFPFDYSLTEGILSFTRGKENINNLFHNEIFYIDDINRHIRWLISSNHRINDFLDELEEPRISIDINNLFTLYPYIINSIRLKSGKVGKITDGSLQVWKKSNNLINNVEDVFWESFSVNFQKNINSGIIEFKLYADKKWKSIYRTSFDKTGSDLISNEQNIISFLSNGSYSTLIPPLINTLGTASMIFLETVYGEMDYHQTLKNIDKIINGLIELYTFTQSEITIREFLEKENILNMISVIGHASDHYLIPGGVSQINVDRLLNEMMKILQEIEMDSKIPVSLFNNNMLPWNMTMTNGKIILFNWEYATFDLPMLFDLFSYSSKHIESFENPESQYLITEIRNYMKSAGLVELLNKFRIDFNLHLKLYILYESVNELIILLDKRVVRPEFNLKLFLWLETIYSLPL